MQGRGSRSFWNLSYLKETKSMQTYKKKSIEKAKIGQHEMEERAMLAKLFSIHYQREQLRTEVEKHRECDPQIV